MRFSLRLFSSVIAAVIAAPLIFGTDSTWNASISYRGELGLLHTDSIRCLASSIYSFSREYGVVVSYEDAPLLNNADIVDVTDTAYVSSGKLGRFFIPRGGPLDVDFAITPALRPTSNRLALQSIINAYTKEAYPGYYKLVEESTRFEIVPFATLDISGKRIDVESILNRRTSVVSEGRTGEQVLDNLLKEIKNQSGVTIVLGTVLQNDVKNCIVRHSLRNVRVSDVINEVFLAAGRSTSLLLLFDPTMKYYVLSFFGAI